MRVPTGALLALVACVTGTGYIGFDGKPITRVPRRAQKLRSRLLNGLHRVLTPVAAAATDAVYPTPEATDRRGLPESHSFHDADPSKHHRMLNGSPHRLRSAGDDARAVRNLEAAVATELPETAPETARAVDLRALTELRIVQREARSALHSGRAGDAWERLNGALELVESELLEDPQEGQPVMMDKTNKMRSGMCADRTDSESCKKFMKKACSPGSDMQQDGHVGEFSSGGGHCQQFFSSGETRKEFKREKREKVKKEETKPTEVQKPTEEAAKTDAPDNIYGEGMAVSGWRREYGHRERDTYESVCASYPDNEWCRNVKMARRSNSKDLISTEGAVALAIVLAAVLAFVFRSWFD